MAVRKLNNSRKSFSKDFKINAVKMTMKKGVMVKDVAGELDVPVQYLSNWRKDYLKSKELETAEERVDAISENTRLRDENKRLKMELEILKKAAIYFASQK